MRSTHMVPFWAALLALGCASSTAQPLDTAGSADAGDVAPARLVIGGQYSDERFLDMMAAHHAMAIAMAQVEIQHGSRPELVQLARGIVTAQTKEIDDMRRMKRERYGTSQVTLQTSPEEMDNDGVLAPEQLSKQSDVDQAFIDSMTPHHAGAIRMASVVRLRSRDTSILVMARGIIDAQAQEVGKMIAWRQQWFAGAP